MSAPVATNSEGRGEREAVISVRGLTVGFSDKLILENLDLDVWRGEILGIVGGSGTGKSVLLRTITIAVGISTPPVKPCPARNRIIWLKDVESAQASEKAVNRMVFTAR